MPIFTDLINGQYAADLHVAPGAPDIPGNRTWVDWSLRVRKLTGTGYHTLSPVPWFVTCEGATIASGGWTYDFGGTSEIIVHISGLWVPHAEDGSMIVNFVAAIDMANPPGGTGNPGGNTVLNRIPRGPRVRHAGTWKPSVAFVRHAGAWRPAIPYVRHAGTWRPVS